MSLGSFIPLKLWRSCSFLCILYLFKKCCTSVYVLYNDSYSSRCDLVQFVISSVPDICTFILYSVISTVLLKKNFKLLEDIHDIMCAVNELIDSVIYMFLFYLDLFLLSLLDFLFILLSLWDQILHCELENIFFFFL